MENDDQVVAPLEEIETKKYNRIFLYFVFINLLSIIFFFILGVKSANAPVKASPAIYLNEQSPQDAKVELPPYFTFLKDNSFSKWSAYVKGVLKEKNEKQFTIEPISETYSNKGVLTISKSPNAKNIPIDIPPSDITFYITSKNGGGSVPITYEKIPLNSIVRGSVYVFYLNEKVVLLGKSFSVTEQ